MADQPTPPRRSYRMTARQAAAQATVERILNAAVDLYTTRDFQDVTLDDVAARAGVTVPTVFRRFGSKDGLLEAAAAHARKAVIQQRHQAIPGDLPGAVAALLDHYDLWGDRVLRLLAQEDRVPAIRTVTDQGRRVHHEWVLHTFAPLLPDTEPQRTRRIAQLSAVCDVQLWKLLHRDLHLSREQTGLALLELLRAL